MKNRSLLCVILAAGKGTRMKSDLPKVMHKVAGEPMVTHVIRAASALSPDDILVAIGPDMDMLADAVAPHNTVVQHDRLGTGHALKIALQNRDLNNTDVLVLFGDVPLVPVEALQNLVARHRQDDMPGVTILAMQPDSPLGYGRLVTDDHDYVTEVVEELDATDVQRAITLCNSGMMILRGEKLNNHLANIKNNNAKGEYYLLDVLPLMRADDQVAAYTLGPADDLNGVNDRAQLAGVEQRLQQKLRTRAMKNGVTMIDPSSVYLSADTQFGQDIVIEPNVVMGPGVIIEDNVTIRAFCHFENVHIQSGSDLGPFARVREHTHIGTNVHIGNFVEIKKSVIGAGTKAGHHTYLCDLDMGENINVGAGALFSNYDGKNKYRTKIGDGAFIGANATIVSPVAIGNDSYVSAGSTITEDVPNGKLAFGRARQTNRDHTEKTIEFSEKQKAKK